MMNSEEFLIETNLGIGTNQTHVKAVNGQIIKANIDKLITLVQQFGQTSTGNLALDEVTISIKITEDGNVVLLGSGGTASDVGTMTLRFKQATSSSLPASDVDSGQANRQPQQPAAKLVSDAGVDYTKLKTLLMSQQWQAANQETWDVMCKALHKNQGSYLLGDDIKQIPCQDLQIVDHLWQEYSQGRFGFTPQKRIYDDSVGSNSK